MIDFDWSTSKYTVTLNVSKYPIYTVTNLRRAVGTLRGTRVRCRHFTAQITCDLGCLLGPFVRDRSLRAQLSGIDARGRSVHLSNETAVECRQSTWCSSFNSVHLSISIVFVFSWYDMIQGSYQKRINYRKEENCVGSVVCVGGL